MGESWISPNTSMGAFGSRCGVVQFGSPFGVEDWDMSLLEFRCGSLGGNESIICKKGNEVFQNKAHKMMRYRYYHWNEPFRWCDNNTSVVMRANLKSAGFSTVMSNIYLQFLCCNYCSNFHDVQSDNKWFVWKKDWQNFNWSKHTHPNLFNLTCRRYNALIVYGQCSTPTI